jgi:oligosaccharide repeat unit polymerase
MAILTILIISSISILVSKSVFKKWFNHLLIYTISWTLFLILYELRLVRYIEISTEAFYIYFITQIGLISGVLTVFFARNVFEKTTENLQNKKIESILFENNFKLLKNIIIITSFVGLFSAYQHWKLLLDKFGSVTEILIRANLIYRMRVAGELEGGIPYLSILPYVGIILSGIYTANKNKISIYTFLPLLVIIIKDAASVGRGGIFVGFFMLIISFFLYKHWIANNRLFQEYRNNRAIIFGSIFLFLIVVISLTLVIEFRGKYDAIKGKTMIFKKYEDIPFFNASTYFYFSSNVGVFSKYFEMQNEHPMIGENTFLPIYNMISKFGVIQHPDFYPQGYSIPQWTNSATYLKEIHADFGNIGLFSIPYFLSLLSTFFWFRFYNKGDLISFVCLTYLVVINSFAIFNMITRAAFFLLSFFTLIILIYLFENFWKSRNQESISED